MRIRNITRQNSLFVLCAIATVAVSLLMRPQLFSERLTSTEWNTATVLRHLEIWQDAGPSTYAFNPVVTYTAQTDKFINNNASNEEDRLSYMDARGNYYYTSYPQFGYIAPWIFFKLTFTEPTTAGLRLFSVLVQIFTALLIAALVYRITRARSAAAVGFSTYMLLPNIIDNYMSDMLVVLFFVSSTYLFLRVVSDSKKQKATLVLFSASLFLMIYTEYIGYLFAGTVFLYAVANWKKESARPLMWISILIPVVATLLVVFQYALVSDVKTFWSVMTNRYDRSYMRATELQAVTQIIIGYLKWYGPALAAAFGMLVMSWIISFTTKQKEWLSSKEAAASKIVLFMFAVPVLAHHAGLIQWTAYHTSYISLLKSGPLISFGVAMAFWVLVHRTQVAKPTSRNALVITFLIVCAAACVPFYVHFFRPQLAFNQSYCNLGEAIARQTADDTVIFIKDAALIYHMYPMHPTIVTCAGKNMEIYRGEWAARRLIERNDAQAGIIFTLAHFGSEGVEILKVEKISLSK